jgi:hypothetical protein
MPTRADVGLSSSCSGGIMPLVALQPSGTVTFVFTDIEGSTALLEDLGAEAFKAGAGRPPSCFAGAFGAQSGYEVDDAGDGLFYAFASASVVPPDNALSADDSVERRLPGRSITLECFSRRGTQECPHPYRNPFAPSRVVARGNDRIG